MKAIISVAAAAGLAAPALVACAAGSTAPAATVTATHTVTNVKTQAVAEPAPTVTKTVYVTASGQAGGGSAPTGGSTSGGGPAQGASPAPSPGANQVIVRFNGSGTQNTASFTTPDSWHLSWSYWSCPGGQSNFQVSEYNADGSLDLNGISVNELGTGRGPVATYAYGDAGTHYLSVNTEGCSWSMVPVTG